MPCGGGRRRVEAVGAVWRDSDAAAHLLCQSCGGGRRDVSVASDLMVLILHGALIPPTMDTAWDDFFWGTEHSPSDFTGETRKTRPSALTLAGICWKRSSSQAFRFSRSRMGLEAVHF